MSKVCVLGDTHFGVRSDSRVFSNYYRKFYDEVFFPALIERKITDIFQLGDLFDRRKYVNFLTLAECREYFFDKVQQLGMHLHVLVGNHDIFWKETLSVNSPSLLLKDYNCITLYQEPSTIKIDDLTADIIPWICNANEKEIFSLIKESKSTVCLGHFEIAGFQMYKGIESHEGLPSKLFKKYDMVLSGHYHHRSRNGNIVYVGTPMEHTWADFEDPRGFHIFDTNTRDLEFIQNPFNIFHKIYYDDTNGGGKPLDFSFVKDCHVKLVVVNKTNFYGFERFVEKIYEQNPAELKIVEDLSAFEEQALQDDDIDIEDTLTLLSHYVENLDTNADKSRIKTLMKTLYVEAQNIDSD